MEQHIIERITVLETKMIVIENNLMDIKSDIKSISSDVHQLTKNFSSSKSWLSGLVVGISFIFTGILEGVKYIWEQIAHLK